MPRVGVISERSDEIYTSQPENSISTLFRPVQIPSLRSGMTLLPDLSTERLATSHEMKHEYNH